MNSDLKENKVEEKNIKKIKEILSSDRAVNAGVVLISEAQKKDYDIFNELQNKRSTGQSHFLWIY